MISLSFLYIIAGIMCAFLIAGIVYILVNRVRNADEPENETIIENYMPQYANGYSEGIVKEMEFGEERVKIVFNPRDINYIRELKENNILEPITLYFNKRQIIPINISSHRNKIKCFPDDIDLLPEQLKETRFGKKIMEIITENNKLNDESELYNARIKHVQKMGLELASGKLAEKYVEISQEILKDKSELIKKEDKKFETK